MAKRKQIEKINSKIISRGFSLAKMGLRTARMAASHAVKSALQSQIAKEAGWSQYLARQAEVLAQDLGQLKGSAMKVGQLLSTYGEHFLPVEANEWLKTLQSESPTLAWPAIEKVLLQELSQDRINELEIDHEPLAAASIGQVHRAMRKRDGRQIVLKIQYPGVDKAIDTDLKFLKTVLSLGPLLPKGPRFDAIFNEVRTMLYQEVDYRIELATTQKMFELLRGDARYRVAEAFPEYSSQRVLATEYMHGTPIDAAEILELSLERRNRLGESFLDLYLREMLDFKLVQTDPHFGNYRIELNENGQDRLVLFDFGAIRVVPEDYINAFVKVMDGGLTHNRDLIIEGGTSLKVIYKEDEPELIKLYVELCYLITEPFARGDYDWKTSDLPTRVAKKGAEVIRRFHLRAPPHETVFLDRKLGGTFIFLSALGCKADWHDLVLKRVKGFGQGGLVNHER